MSYIYLPSVFGVSRPIAERRRLVIVGSFGNWRDMLVFAPIAALQDYVESHVVVAAGLVASDNAAGERVAGVRAALTACGVDEIPVLSTMGCPRHPLLPGHRCEPVEQSWHAEELGPRTFSHDMNAVVLSGGARAAIDYDRLQVVAMAPEDAQTSDYCDTCYVEREYRTALRMRGARPARPELAAFADNVPVPRELAHLIGAGAERDEPTGELPPLSVQARQIGPGNPAVAAVLAALRFVIQGRRDKRSDLQFWADVLAAGILNAR